MNKLWVRLKNRLREPDVNQLPPVPAIITRYPILFSVLGLFFLACAGTFVFFYFKYAMIIDDKFGDGGIRTNSSVYAMPRQIAKGDKLTTDELLARLQRGGYTEDASNKVGYYQRTPQGVVITTGPSSYFQQHQAVVRIEGDQVTGIFS